VLGELGLDAHGQRLRVVTWAPITRSSPRVETRRAGASAWTCRTAALAGCNRRAHREITIDGIEPTRLISNVEPASRYVIPAVGRNRERTGEVAPQLGVNSACFWASRRPGFAGVYNLGSVYIACPLTDGRGGFGISLVEASACAGGRGIRGIPDAVREARRAFSCRPRIRQRSRTRLPGARRTGGSRVNWDMNRRRGGRTALLTGRVVRDLQPSNLEVVS